jgi:hypothetical protein
MHERLPEEKPCPRAHRLPSAGPGERGLLRLQAAAGNRAVAGHISVQRNVGVTRGVFRTLVGLGAPSRTLFRIDARGMYGPRPLPAGTTGYRVAYNCRIWIGNRHNVVASDWQPTWLTVGPDPGTGTAVSETRLRDLLSDAAASTNLIDHPSPGAAQEAFRINVRARFSTYLPNVVTSVNDDPPPGHPCP